MALPQGAYNHKDHEAEILKRWLESGAYKPNSDPKIENSENWTLICPPPNAYGRPHVGNISGYAYIDAMARIQRMKGKNVLVIPGKDHAGLEGEGVFVREVLEKQGKKKFDMKREDFYAEMMEFFMKNMKQGREDEQNIGLSADFDLDTFTLDPEIVDTVLDTFIEMYQKGMIYKGVRIVNWDPKARTAVADNQVIYEDAVTPFYYFKYSFGDPDPKALELKNQFKGKEIEWVFERNKTKDEKSHLPFAFGYLAEPPLREADLQLQIKEGGFSHNHYNAKLKDFARANRKQQTKGEAILWSKLRNKQFLGLKFLRQRPIDNYIADFLQPDLKLIIEIGMSHDDKKYDYDTHRENKLKQLGFSVLRFSEFDVKTKLDEVLQTIANFFDKNSTPPAPSQEGHIPIEIIGVGYDTEIKSGDKLKGKVVGILMRMNAPHRLVVVNDQSGVNVGKEYILSLQNEFQRIFEFESKHYAGAHIILFNQYPDDKFYTNGFIIGTVRPETIFADTAIACSPDDERYKDFVGKEVEVEFLGIKKKLNFISDYSVLPDFGTGLLKITPAHANEDWEIAQRHPKECLPAIQVIGYDLKMNSLTGKYEGMKIKEAREAMEEDMIKHGNLIHVDREYKNKVAIAERTKAPIEPLLSSQWYLSYDVPVGEEVKTLRQAALEMVNGKGFTADAHSVETQDFASLQRDIASSTGEVKILPPSMVGKFNNWMNNLRDWAISRSLWWGYRLPVWYHGEVKEEIGADGQVRELIRLSGGEKWLTLEYNNPNHIKVQKECPGEGWFQDENVLDTWFSSAQWPYATLMKYGLLKDRYPTDVMLSGFDILENWDSRMMMFSYFKTGQVPFKTLYLTGLVKGTDGQKMSKSKGNVVSMDEIREKYGTDAVRMVYYYQNTAGADYAMTYEKLETFKRFANKIWNASKFVLMNIVENIDTNVNSLKLEELKLKENIELFKFITEAKEHITKNIDEYEFGLATFNLYQYFWHDFADVHIEAVKKYVLSQRDKTTNEVIQEPNAEEKAETTRVLLFTLKSFIKMLHPFMPFITQRIWDEVPKEEGENEFVMYSRW